MSPSTYDANILSLPDIEYDFPKESLGEIFFERMSKNKEVVAQVDAVTGKEDTYEKLLQRSVRTAMRLRERGFKAGDIIGTCSHNHFDSCVPFIAGQFLGLINASWDKSQPLDEITRLLLKVPPSIIFVAEDCVELIEQALENAGSNIEIIVFGKSDKHGEFQDFVKPHAGEENFKISPIENNKQTACIVFSSGSSGLPKGICLNHYNFLAQIIYRANVEDIDEDLLRKETPNMSFPFKILVYTSLYWISSYISLVAAIYNGCCRVLSSNFNKASVLQTVADYKVLFLLLTPWQVAELCKIGRPHDIKITSPLRISVAGSSISERLMLEFKKLIPEADINTVYAMTETTGLVTMFQAISMKHRKFMNEKPVSCGLPVPGFSYKVVDPETEQILGPNQHGELRLKTKLIMNGYYDQDSSESLDSDGWLKTGDIVYYDEDTCFFVVDRLKDIFKYRSDHVQPSIIEDVLLKHHAVKGAAVVGIPNEDDDNHAFGVVELESGATVIPEQLIEYVNDTLEDKYHLRAGIRIVQSIPLTATGKVRRRKVLENVLKGLF